MEAIQPIERRRIWIYLAWAFGISWAAGLMIYVRSDMGAIPVLDSETGVNSAFVLFLTVYMFSPALAHALTRLLTREGWQDTGLSFEFRKGWPYWVMAWIGTPLLIAIGALVYFVLFPQYYDAGLVTIKEFIVDYEATSGEVPYSAGAFVAIQFLQGILISPLLNLLPIFGEEFGWRGYLQPKLLALGERKTYLLMGVIWGLWHAPIILLGQNYGLEYPGAPWMGVLLYLWIAFLMGTFYGWVTLRGGSIWPAMIAHAVLNGIGGGVYIFVVGEPNLLVGPMVTGVVGSIGFALMTAWIFLRGNHKAEAGQKVISD